MKERQRERKKVRKKEKKERKLKKENKGRQSLLPLLQFDWAPYKSTSTPLF